MTPEELKAIIAYLRERVRLDLEKLNSQVIIIFDAPTQEEMADAGLNTDGVKQILQATWWAEMVTDIIETPDYCDPDDPPQQVLEYAKDVVSDYVRKRFPLKRD